MLIEREAITRLQAVAIAVIIAVAVIGGIYYYVIMGPTPTTEEKKIIFTYPFQQIVSTIDPAKATDETSCCAVINMYDPLFFPVKFENGTRKTVPWLVEEWFVSEDGMTYTMKLKEGIKFHDGTELTAEDVAFSMDRMLSIGMGFSYLWEGVLQPGDTEVVDKYTFKFHLRKPYSPFISTLIQLFVVNKKLIMEHLEPGDFGEYGDYGQKYLEDHDAGSGPYKLKSWERGVEIVFEKFDDYWRGWKENSPTEVHCKVILEEATVVTLFKKGELDMTHMWLTPETFEELKQIPGVIVDEDLALQIFHIPMNMKKPPTDNKWFRYAICYAFDYETACELAGGAPQAEGPVPLPVEGHAEDVLVFHRNVTLAQYYLNKSGYKPGEVTIDIVYITAVELERKICLLLKSNLEEIGIGVNIIGETWGRLCDLATSPETAPHLSCIYDRMKTLHPDSHTYGKYHSSVQGTWRSISWMENSTIDSILEQARATADPEEALELYKEAQRLITYEAPAIFVFNNIHRIAMHDWVKGYVDPGIMSFDLYWWNLEIIGRD